MQTAAHNNTIDLNVAIGAIRTYWARMFVASIAAAVVTYGATFLVQPTFTAKAVIFSPQEQQSAATAALSSLTSLPGLAGLAGVKSPADQYVAVMQSETLSNRIIQRFNLQKLYEKTLLVDTRGKLAQQVRIAVSKKDNLISIEVDDHDPKRAADMANAYVDELRKLTNQLALTDAQQRRVFFEEQLRKTRDELTTAQLALQESGITTSAVKNDAKAAIETYSRIRAELESAQARLSALRLTMADKTVEVRQLETRVNALASQLAQLEAPTDGARSSTYISAYRSYRYLETLFEIYARQFESARLDEARDGIRIQVLDAATAPEAKSKPRRAFITLIAGAASLLLSFLYFFLRHPGALGKAA